VLPKKINGQMRRCRDRAVEVQLRNEAEPPPVALKKVKFQRTEQNIWKGYARSVPRAAFKR
jgi:hypothetical protein